MWTLIIVMVWTGLYSSALHPVIRTNGFYVAFTKMLIPVCVECVELQSQHKRGVDYIRTHIIHNLNTKRNRNDSDRPTRLPNSRIILLVAVPDETPTCAMPGNIVTSSLECKRFRCISKCLAFPGLEIFLWISGATNWFDIIKRETF